MADGPVTVDCCVVGGGPAGMMLGFLLARAGISVAVLEKHADFLRDFRGDTIHPSTLRLMDELGLLDALLKLPHQKAFHLNGMVGDFELQVADFTHLSPRWGFVALMPQWDFLDFLSGRARRFKGFHLHVQAAVTGLVRDGGRVAGVIADTPDGPLEVRAALTVGCDGRHSTVRKEAGLAVEELGAPMDVLWFSLSRDPGDPGDVMGRFDAGRIFIMINRGAHWQCGLVIPKGTFADVQARGLEAFRADLERMAPFVKGRGGDIASWDDVKLLTVAVDRLNDWALPGLLCIGDAAHTMSPIGGVGINLAIQDAVAAANLLAAPLSAGTVNLEDLKAVQRRRAFPARVTQAGQLFVQRRVISRLLGRTRPIRPPLIVRLLARFPILRRIPARVIGIGVRSEHIRTPEAAGA
ncbi:MAG TPA: FAD-dependent oxidoreductase [Alphaproteobacteria bacterium]|nr:FAD-dependent oxidoreductase [Alphaproteobacteria bacterium]